MTKFPVLFTLLSNQCIGLVLKLEDDEITRLVVMVYAFFNLSLFHFLQLHICIGKIKNCMYLSFMT